MYDDSDLRVVYPVSWVCPLRSDEGTSKLFVSTTKDQPNDNRKEDSCLRRPALHECANSFPRLLGRVMIELTPLPQFRRSAGRRTQTIWASWAVINIHPLVFQPDEAQVPLPSPRPVGHARLLQLTSHYQWLYSNTTTIIITFHSY